MAADDKLRLKLAAKRMEAWKEYKLQPPKVVKRCKSVLFAPGQDKPEVVHTDKDTIVSNGKLSIGSAEKAMRLDSGDRNSADGNGYEYNHSGNVPAHLKAAPMTAKPRKNSPFKREKKLPIIIRA